MKEYGKLTSNQFRFYIRKLPELRVLREELIGTLRENDSFLDKLMREGLNWPELYELPFIDLLSLFIVSIGRGDSAKELADQPNPHQTVMEWWNEDFITEPSEVDLPHFFAFVVALDRNIAAIERYHRTIHALIQEAKAGKLDSLFKVVTIDRAAIACPSVAIAIGRAELTNDAAFFAKLSKALKGPSQKVQRSLDDVRFVLYAVRDLGLHSISDTKLKKLIVDELHVYPHPDPSDAAKALGKQFREAKKYSTT